MGNSIIHNRKRYDNAQNSAQNSAPFSAQTLTPTAGDVVIESFEMFHSAPDIAAAPPESEPDMYNQGIAEGQRRAETLHSNAIAAMENSLAMLQSHFSQRLKDIQHSQASTLMSVFEAALPALVRQSFFQDASEMILALGSQKTNGPITIKCAPDDLQAVTQLFERSAHPEQFNVSAAQIPQNQMQFEWDSGGADIDYRKSAATAMQHLISQYKAASAAPVDSTTLSSTD